MTQTPTTRKTRYLIATKEYPTAELAWENSEGLAYCEAHATIEGHEAKCYLIPVPNDLRDSETGKLIVDICQCETCYDSWQEQQVDYYQEIEVDRHEQYLDYRRQNLNTNLTKNQK